MTERFVLWFQHLSDDHQPRVGGKNASLGQMVQAELPVPPGFAVTTDAYLDHLVHGNIHDDVRRRLAGLDHTDLDRLHAAAAEVREMIESVEVPALVADAVAQSYRSLCSSCEADDIPVAVRSSATAEDLPDASFAGQQDTFLWVRGAEGVIEHMKKCWASLYTDRAVAYRAERGFDHHLVHMSVVVQKMIRPKAAGVAFTLNPTNGDRSKIAIDSAWGFGESVVSGEVTPDNYLVDKVIFEIVERKVSAKEMEYRLEGDKVVRVDLEGERSASPSLTDDEIIAVARLAKQAERHYGCPQDVEWAIDSDLPEPDNVVLLQSRPETVWSQKPRRRVSEGAPKDFMSSLVSSLLKPDKGF